MSECSDTESRELVERLCRRFRLTWNASAPDVVPLTDSHDQRMARVRRVTQRERHDCAALGWLSARAVKLPPMFVDSVQVSVAHWMARVVRYDAILGRELKARIQRVDAQAGIREAQVGSEFQW